MMLQNINQEKEITTLSSFDRKTKILVLFVTGLLITGTVFYHFVEGWDFFNSFYFSIITLATIGYGDMTPQTIPGKLFTIFYIFAGLGTFARFALHFSRKQSRKIYTKTSKK